MFLILAERKEQINLNNFFMIILEINAMHFEFGSFAW